MNNASNRILHVAKWYPNEEDTQNGVFVRNQIRAVKEHAYQVVVYWGRSRSGYRWTEDVEDGIPVLRLYLPTHSRARNVLRKWKSLSYASRKWFPDGGPDLVHMHITTNDQWLSYRFARKLGIPSVLTEHWSGYIDGRFDELRRFSKNLHRRIFQRVDCVTVVSALLRDAITERLSPRSIEVIPNVVTRPVAPDFDRTDTGRFAVLADLDDSIKNISGVLRAFALMAKSDPDVHLDLIGGGHDRSMLERLSHDLELTNRVSFHGRTDHENSMNLLSRSDTLILNSRRETFSIVTLEALALGMKLICTRCGGPEAFLPDDLVDWVPVDSTEDLYRAMLRNKDRIFPDQTKVDALLQAFLPETVAQEWNRIYSERIKSDR